MVPRGRALPQRRMLASMNLQQLDEPHRVFAERVILAVALPAVAGAVNASGFLAVGTYTSHVSGHVARIGDELAQSRPQSALGFAAFVAAFFFGAVSATAMVDRARRLLRARYVAPLLVQTGALGLFAVSTGIRGPGRSVALTGLLCFAMGMQNALVTKISGAVVRTTHVTGIVTDLGIESVRVAGWIRQELRRTSFLGKLEIAGGLFSDPEWKKLRLHAVILASFFIGAVVGPNLFLRFGQIAMIAPCFVLLFLAAFDFLLGIRAHDDHHPAGTSGGLPPALTSTTRIAPSGWSERAEVGHEQKPTDGDPSAPTTPPTDRK